MGRRPRFFGSMSKPRFEVRLDWNQTADVRFGGLVPDFNESILKINVAPVEALNLFAANTCESVRNINGYAIFWQEWSGR